MDPNAKVGEGQRSEVGGMSERSLGMPPSLESVSVGSPMREGNPPGGAMRSAVPPYMGFATYGRHIPPPYGPNAEMFYNYDPMRGGAADGSSSHASQQKARLRVSRACDRCRSQKIKCSGTQPCDSCSRHSKVCTFSDTSNSAVGQGTSGASAAAGFPTKRAKSVSHPREPPIQREEATNLQDGASGYASGKGSDKMYVEHLENRVRFLESLMSSNADSMFEQETSETPWLEFPPFVVSKFGKKRFVRRFQNQLIMSLCGNIYDNLSEEKKKKVTKPRGQYYGWNMSGCRFLAPERLPMAPSYELPEEPSHYVDYFFKNINPMFTILHEKLFRDQLKDYKNLMNTQAGKDDDEKDANTYQTRLFSAILCLVYALAVRFCEFSKPDGPDIEVLKMEEALFKYGYNVVNMLSFEWESYELIQSWLLIALYLRVTYRQTACVSAIMRAISLSNFMGVARAQVHITYNTAYERVKSRRIFWSVYTMDRILGVQSGRYIGFADRDVELAFPSLDYEKEKDPCINLSGFAMLHVARVANFIYSSKSEVMPYPKLEQMDKELMILNDWLEENGFGDTEIFGNRPEQIEECTSKAQVKLHFYDVMFTMHGKLLFNYVGHNLYLQGYKLQRVLQSCRGMLYIINSLNERGKLLEPWYNTLLLTFNVATAALCLLRGGMYPTESKNMFKNALDIVSNIANQDVKDKSGKVVVQERYKMAKECLWALKVTNHTLALQLEEDFADLRDIGFDYGSARINQEQFSELGIVKDVKPEAQTSDADNAKNTESDPFSPGKRPTKDAVTPMSKTPDTGGAQSSSKAHTVGSGFDNPEDQNPDFDLLQNFRWFDQWLDFNYDFS
ncbi:Piso0_000391 [Millerozyma farinosa CBS 7064]|uniref:Piso0_000391 protein n=1 Tax=Pichia sorbitophila (strain ATCC MYA-4447 / BCRC 22081 / CBS 7064 / NBRC 10061 / NRRL Y-12695) TaxID=559304 RepID=G8YTV7_PICSO|nr:Piso0_000391 [Millerozyma farinosa CBS 7064]CCE73358.1 Piso0_000391 [Millerozyma farinosa CBS 7064]